MKNLILSLIIISTISCRKEFSYDFEHIPQVNVSCFIQAGDTMRVRLSYLLGDTLAGTNLADKDYITNAEVYLYEDDIFREKLIYKEIPQKYVEKGWYYSNAFIPSEKHNYELRISVPGYDTVYAKTDIPAAIPIDSVQIDGKVYNDTIFYDGTTDFSVNIFFKDTPESKNYYNYWSNIIFISYDPAIEPNRNSEYYTSYLGQDQLIAFFSDKIFDGNNYVLNSEFSIGNSFDYTEEPVSIKFKLYSLSYDAYAFYKSSYLYYKKLENPFFEPVIIYSNIENGTGVFAGLSFDMDSIVFAEPKKMRK